MTEALIGLGGVVVGAVLGGTGKYWLLRRDAWREARTSGLLLLADVRAIRAAPPAARVVSDTELGVKSWQLHREALAGFRQGNFPSGFRAPEWLKLAGHFAQLNELYGTGQLDARDDDWGRAKEELAGAEGLLIRFEQDPPVFWYVVQAAIKR